MAKPESSDWGKLNSKQYYCLLAIDVDRALACAEMGKYEQIVMQYVRERAWGKATREDKKGRKASWPEPRRLTWSLPHIAAETGLLKPRLSQAKSSLVASGMLIEDGGTIRPNKDASAWVFPPGHFKAGQPRLCSTLLAYAIRAQNWRVEYAPEPENDPNVSTDVVTPERNPITPERNGPLHQSVMAITPERNPITPERNGHIEERASEDSPSGRCEEERSPSESAQSARAAEDEVLEPFDPGPGDPSVVGPGKNSPQAIDLERWASQFGTDRNHVGYGFWAREACALAPAEWVRRLLERRVVGQGNRPSVAVLSKILADWRDAGVPEYLPAARGSGSTAEAGAGATNPLPETKTQRRSRELKESLRAFAAREMAREEGDES